jgi:hypothetical protein
MYSITIKGPVVCVVYRGVEEAWFLGKFDDVMTSKDIYAHTVRCIVDAKSSVFWGNKKAA